MLRAEVVRRRMAYDADPETFAATWADAEEAVRERLARAQERVAHVELGDAELLLVAQVCAAFEVDGLRADLVTARAAVAHAAWHDRDRVTKADIRAAARLSLPHRRRRNPFDAPGLDEDLLDQLLGDDEPAAAGGAAAGHPAGRLRGHRRRRRPGRRAGRRPAGHPARPGRLERLERARGPGAEPAARAAGPTRDRRPTRPRPTEDPRPTAAAVSVAAPGQTYRTRLFTARGVGAGTAGRRSRAVTTTGRTVGSTLPDGEHRPLHLSATVRAAAPHQAPAGGRPAAGSGSSGPTCGTPSPRAASPTSCCWPSTPPARWPRASGWRRSRPPSSRCCSTPTSAATRSGW